MIQKPVAELTRNEGLKTSNPQLAGTLVATLSDATVDHFQSDDCEFLKFHGVYQQDDRDKRKTGKHYMMMVRTKFPAGVITGSQYLACDRLAEQFGNNTLRVTTRQCFQFHGIIKSRIRQTIAELNHALITTLGACGDVERNIMAPPTPATSPIVDEVIHRARRLSDVLLPATPAYHQIWVEGAEVKLDECKTFEDPLYQQRYLPRKFKTAFAIPPLNDVDILTNDLGFIVIGDGHHIEGFNLIAGGGMGRSHGNKETFPRLADVIGFLTPENLESAAKAVITIHRDFGDRTNRKHARLKYVLEERGAGWFRTEVEKRAGFKLEPAKPFRFTKQGDLLGWHKQTNGNVFLGLFVENGRIEDRGDYRLKTGLRKVIEPFLPEVRCTPSQNLLLVNIPPEQQSEFTQILAEHGVLVDSPLTPTRLASMSCPALPTCGLALAESERIMPSVLSEIEKLLEETGLRDEEIVIRMTGCPNGCARPYMAEIGFVGKGPNRYQLYLGGNVESTRLNWLFKDVVKTDEIVNELRALFSRFSSERAENERFGDFCERVIKPATSVLS
ncbi:MAG: NADPH-dependent assimilatory sulfite reductase hemoprotein subunit [Verrucomicrobia bacterium]|nr:NADPH-dependent assimilatory sulfite reductase hemoprotein subunit [Verrucomicrobiota bacterium]